MDYCLHDSPLGPLLLAGDGAGLRDGTADAGLFGVAKGAAIKNLVVRGSVTGTGNAAGILAKAKNEACTIENCGNEAAVTVTKSGGGNAGAGPQHL